MPTNVFHSPLGFREGGGNPAVASRGSEVSNKREDQ